jgi:hypothetical protein
MKRPYTRHTPRAPARPASPSPEAQLAQPARPEMRPEVRDEDPRARAEARAAELLGVIDDLSEGQDKYYVDPDSIPDGWSYEWKTNTVLGARNPSYEVALAQTGWEPVPLKRHPFMMPKGWTGGTIERDGMILMERPLAITERVKAHEYRKARDQVRAKEEQLNAAPAGQFQRQKSDGAPMAKVSKSYEPMPIPD